MRVRILPLALLLASHCSESSGTARHDDAGANEADVALDAAAADCGTLEWGDPACTSCTNANCCNLELLCEALASCAPLHQCWTQCGGDRSCQTACGSTYIDSISNYNAILNCQTSACLSVCRD
jgi:hypothetical protein